MPSLTLIVPNSSGYPPAACTPSLLALASRSRLRLHGVISFQELATPICGLAKSSSPIPTARSMPREAVASRPSVTFRLRGLMSGWLGSVGWLTDRDSTPQPPDTGQDIIGGGIRPPVYCDTGVTASAWP